MFYKQLLSATALERSALLALPFIRDGAAGKLAQADYLDFLSQAYHHVQHTLPLIMACGARLPGRYEWLRTAMSEYVKEETGHQEWILNDIESGGGDPAAVRAAQPDPSVELMVAYAYDTIARVNPLGFLGMVLVLEGTSTAVASRAADALQKTLHLPDAAFTYLRSHGALDVQHIRFYESLVDRIVDMEDRAALVHAAKMFYRLYGEIFRALEARRRARAEAEAAA